MNNNHYYRPTLTGNKNRHKVNAHIFGPILKVQSNKKPYIQNSSLFPESQIFDQSRNFEHNSIDTRQYKEQSDSRQRVKTEIVRPKYELLQFQSQKIDNPTAYFPKLKERAQSYQKKKLDKIALEVDIGDSPVSIRELQKSLDYSRSQPNKQRNLTPLQQRTIEVSKLISQSDHLNQEEIMQFSFGLQYNRMSIEKQKSKFPKDIFLGDVRKVKRIFQQQ